jgi:hypothetical protein
MIVRFVRPIVPIALIGLLAAPLQGCFGSFALTGKVFEFNKGLGNIVVQEVVFLVFIIVPVYAFCTFADAIVLNIIEFVTGSNPIASAEGSDPDHRVASVGDGATLELTREGKAVRVVLDDHGRRTERVFRPNGRAWDVYDGDGLLVASSDVVDGSLVVRDSAGAVVETVDSARMVAAASAWAVGGGAEMLRAARASLPMMSSLY